MIRYGLCSHWHRSISGIGASAAADVEPSIAPVQIDHSQLLIDGQFVDAASGKTFPTFDPRTGDVIANVAEGDTEDVNRAVRAARKAFDEGPWPKMTAYERSRIILRFADLLEKHNDEVAAIETWDSGKTYEQAAKVEIPMVVRLFRYYAGWVDKIHGLTVPADGPYHVQTLHEPIGVAGQIVPWNFPLLIFSWMAAPALACVLSDKGYAGVFCTLLGLLSLWTAGLPPGVLNVITGFGATAGASLCSHMDVDKQSEVTLELGGKSPFIVCEDADVDAAVEAAHFALFFNQIDSAQFEKIMKYIRSGVENGATLESGGQRIGSKGYYIQPTVFSNDNMLIAKDEIFGPVQSILKFKDLEEVIRRANATSYGLASGVFTQNMDTANTLMRALRVGTVWINCYDVFDAAIPFGGYKMSGQGRVRGIYSLRSYLQVKAVVTALKNPAWL
ncbi:hypothetical protein JHK85_052804 [Glycine max]|nr:hypothetical protein JHK85_052804 [Glycine max]